MDRPSNTLDQILGISPLDRLTIRELEDLADGACPTITHGDTCDECELDHPCKHGIKGQDITDWAFEQLQMMGLRKEE